MIINHDVQLEQQAHSQPEFELQGAFYWYSNSRQDLFFDKVRLRPGVCARKETARGYPAGEPPGTTQLCYDRTEQLIYLVRSDFFDQCI